MLLNRDAWSVKGEGGAVVVPKESDGNIGKWAYRKCQLEYFWLCLVLRISHFITPLVRARTRASRGISTMVSVPDLQSGYVSSILICRSTCYNHFFIVISCGRLSRDTHPQNGKVAKQVYAADWKSDDGGSTPPLPTKNKLLLHSSWRMFTTWTHILIHLTAVIRLNDALWKNKKKGEYCKYTATNS